MNSISTLLLAQVASIPGGGMGQIALIVILVIAATVGLYVSRYKRCPANQILVISGRTRGSQGAAKCLSGGGTFVVPVWQQADTLPTRPIPIEVPLVDALSFENIRVKVPSVFTVAIGTTPELMQNAAVRLLNLSVAEIAKQAEDIIFGQLRQVIASMPIEEINKSRDAFLRKVTESLAPELEKIGIVLINVNIKDLNDSSGYIEAIGQKAAAEAIQQARGDVAEQERSGEVRVANAERDKQVSVAEAQRDKAVRIADITREQQVAEKQATFQEETQVAQADRERRVQVANADAEAVKGESQAKAEVADAVAALAVREAAAYESGETKKAEAAGAVEVSRHRAQTAAAEAQAARVEAERTAEIVAPAKAARAKIQVDAEAEADRIRTIADARAGEITAIAQAEADAEFQRLAKRGEGLGVIVEKCGGADEAWKLLMLEVLPGLADTAAKAISNVKFDKIMVWDGGSAGGGGAVPNFLRGLTGGLPPAMEILRAAGVELPEYMGKLAADIETGAAVTAGATADGADSASDGASVGTKSADS